MRFKLFLLFINMLIFGGLYIMATGRTAGSACRDIGSGISSLSIDEAGRGNFTGLRAKLNSTGQSIVDTCTPH